jgi:hypothetical protein
MALSDDLAQIALAARAHARPDEKVEAILVTESAAVGRTYLCAYGGDDQRTWLALDDDGKPVASRSRVREAVSVAALYEIAVETTPEPPAEPAVATLDALDVLGAREPNVAAALRDAVAAVDELTREVESNYKLRFDAG